MTKPELRLWAEALDALPVPVAVTAGDGRVLVANEAWRALEPDPALRVGDHAFPGRTLRAHAVARDDGRIVWLEDVTETRRLSSTVEHQRGALLACHEDATRSKKDLAEVAAVSSHDLKTALRGISLLAQWIEEDLGERVTPETKQHLDLLRSRVSRTEAMIDALSRYLRLGEISEEPIEVDTGALLDSITRQLARPDTFTVVAATSMPVLFTPRAQLRQVLCELLENAISHHDRANGTVSVAAHDRGDHFEFCVADDGPGLGERTQERVFHLFRTGSGLDPVRHVGVGLALVKRVVESRGGSVSVRASLNRGSTFCFTWPKIAA